MANQSINAVKIIPNDNINLPEPGIKTSGTSTTGTTGVTLKDSSNDFLNSVTNPNGYNVNSGDVVYNLFAKKQYYYSCSGFMRRPNR